MTRTVLFDLDGTLLNTNELIFRSFEYVWEKQGRENIAREMMVPYMGAKLYDMFRELTGGDDAAIQEMIRLYREFNWENHDELVDMFPGVKETLHELREAGIRMGIVTTKIRKTTDMGLKLCGIDGYFDAIVTLDDVTHAKPHPEPVLQALKQLGAEPASAMMVGDSPADILAARAAGVRSIAVGWSLKSLREYAPDVSIKHMHELLDVAGLTRNAK